MEKFKSILKNAEFLVLMAELLAKETETTLRKSFRRYYGMYKYLTECSDEVERLVLRGMKKIMNNPEIYAFDYYEISSATGELIERKICTVDMKSIAEFYVPEVLRKECFDDHIICACILEHCVQVCKEEEFIRDDEKVFRRVKRVWEVIRNEVSDDEQKQHFRDGASYESLIDARIREECEKLPKYRACVKTWKEILENLELEEEDCLAFNAHNPANYKNCKVLLSEMKRKAKQIDREKTLEGALRIEVTDIGTEGESLPRMYMRIHLHRANTLSLHPASELVYYPVYLYMDKEPSNKEIFLLFCMEKLYPIRMKNQRILERNLHLEEVPL